MLKMIHLQAGPFCHVPFGQQGIGHLLHFHIVERLFQNQYPVMGLQAVEQFIPGIIGVGGTHHHLQARVCLPQVFDGLGAVPAFGHAHIDEGQGIGSLLVQRPLQFTQTFLPSVGRIQLNRHAGRCGLAAEQGRFHRIHLLRLHRGRHEDLAKIRMNGRSVVDQQDAPVETLAHAGSGTRCSGIRKVKRAPLPGPSLWAVRWPFISMAARAQLCRPKP